jgi:phosphomannomutase
MAQRSLLSRTSWDGVIAADFTLANVRARCRLLAEMLVARRWSCLVAYDTRFLSAQVALDASRILGDGRVSICLGTSPVPIPAVELGLEQRRTDLALIVSAGNRPYWHNGLITLAPPTDAPLLASPPLENPLDPAPPFPPPPLDPSECQADLRQPYLDALRDAVDIELIRRAPVTIFVDTMNGTTGGFFPAVLGDGVQAKAIEINREADALFSRQTPQPSEVPLSRLRKLTRESDSHLGVALSADGRALVAVDNAGELLPPLDLALLLAHYLARQHRQRGLVVAPAGGSEPPGGLRAWEDALGLKVELANDPPARIAEIVARDRNNMLVGVTSSGEVTLGRSGPTPDGLLVALTLAEIVARYGEKLRSLVEKAKGKS